MLDNCPHFFKVNSEIIVDQDVPHFDDLRLWNFRMGFAEGLGELAGCLADYLNVVDDPVLDQFVALEGFSPALGVAFDSFDRLEDIAQTDTVIPS